jgi:hypothetical protein
MKCNHKSIKLGDRSNYYLITKDKRTRKKEIENKRDEIKTHQIAHF